MEITFRGYIDNPLGRKAAVFSQRQMYHDMYTQKFGHVMLKENGKFNTVLYTDKKNDKWFAHIKVPSEVVPKFYYDVVIEFYPVNGTNKTDNSLNQYGVRFFSNDPAFCFTYEYVFNKMDLFIPELKSKGSKLALRKSPYETNPYLTPGYVKSIYFAFLYMQNKSLFNKANWRGYDKPYSKRELLSNIEDTDKKVADRQRLGEEVKKQKAIEKKRASQKEQRERPKVVSTDPARSGIRVINARTGNVSKPVHVSKVKPIKKK